MPFGASGKHYMNPAMAKKDAIKPKPVTPVSGPSDSDAAHVSEPVDPGAENADSEEIKGHLENLHAKTGGKHMHIHSHGKGHTTHHVGDDGMAEGPNEHGDDEALAEHVKGVMGDGMPDAEDTPMNGGRGHSNFGDLSGV